MTVVLPGATIVTEGVRWEQPDGRVYRRPGNPPIVTWHTTETRVMSRAAVAGHRVPPHLWIDPQTGDTMQTVPLDRPAYALKNGGVETNHRGPNIQVEIFGYAQETPGWSDHRLTKLAELLVKIDDWLEGEYGEGVIGASPPKFWGSDEGRLLASPSAEQRMSEAEWFGARGSVGHQHAPGNDHWDPGGLNVARIHLFASELKTPPPEPSEEVDVWRYIQGYDPDTGKTETAVYRCDGIFRREILPPYWQDRVDPGWRDRITRIPTVHLNRYADPTRSAQ